MAVTRGAALRLPILRTGTFSVAVAAVTRIGWLLGGFRVHKGKDRCAGNDFAASAVLGVLGCGPDGQLGGELARGGGSVVSAGDSAPSGTFGVVVGADSASRAIVGVKSAG